MKRHYLGPYILLFLLAPWSNSASQEILIVSGDFSFGNEIHIEGIGFGEKPNPGPVIYDDVESGEFSDLWSSSGNLRITNFSRYPESTYCGTQNFQGTGGDGNLGYFTGGSPSEYWYCQYWFYLDENFDWGNAGYGNLGSNLANVKLFRLWNPSSINENFVLATMGYAGGSLQYTTENVSNPQGDIYFGNVNSWAKGEWHLFQFEFKESGINENNGIFRWWVDGNLFVEDTDLKTREDYSVFKRPFILGFYDSWNDASTDPNDFFIDDIYIDNTWARVEVGNAANYEMCSQREVQVPIEWGDNSIRFIANPGSFSGQDELYLFIRNATGDVSPGFPVNFSQESPGMPNPPNWQEING